MTKNWLWANNDSIREVNSRQRSAHACKEATCVLYRKRRRLRKLIIVSVKGFFALPIARRKVWYHTPCNSQIWDEFKKQKHSSRGTTVLYAGEVRWGEVNWWSTPRISFIMWKEIASEGSIGNLDGLIWASRQASSHQRCADARIIVCYRCCFCLFLFSSFNICTRVMLIILLCIWECKKKRGKKKNQKTKKHAHQHPTGEADWVDAYVVCGVA